MSEIIKLENVFKIYNAPDGPVYALNGVDFSVYDGEFVAIVGKSGSGKSTLMNMIGCLDTPTSGSCFIKSISTDKMSQSLLSYTRNITIGFVFQGFNLIPGLSAAENIELPLIYRGMKKNERRELAAAALEKVGLYNRMGHRPSQLSGGQQQRVAIARAIAAKPSILLADEPTGNLDSNSGDEIMQIIMSLNAEGKTVVLITHDEKIAACAQRRIHISDGKILGT